MQTSHKFARNSLFIVFSYLITLPIVLFLTPYVLRVLGDSKFGIWALAGVITSYAQLSEMGMTTAIVKFVAEYWARNDIDKITDIVSTSFLSFAVIGGIVATVIILARHFIASHILKVPPELHNEVVYVIVCSIIIFYFNIVFSVFNSILQGIQRMDITSIIVFVSKILNVISLVGFLAAGFGLKGLIMNSAFISALTIAFNVFWVRKLVKGLKISFLRFSFSEFRVITKYSLNVFLGNIMGLGQEPMNKIILSAFTSLSFVTFYEIGSRVKNMVGQLFSIGIMPLLPASSDLHSLGEKDKLERLFLSIARIICIYAMPLYMIGIILAEPFVQVWLGGGYKMAAQAIQILLLSSLFSLIVTPHYLILQGIGKPNLSALVAGVNGVANITIAIVLVRIIGFYGVLTAVLSSIFLAALSTIYLFHKATGFSYSVYFKSLPLKAIAGWCGVAAGLWILTGRIKANSIYTLIGVGTIFCIIYFTVILRHVKSDDNNLFSKLKVILINQAKGK